MGGGLRKWPLALLSEARIEWAKYMQADCGGAVSIDMASASSMPLFDPHCQALAFRSHKTLQDKVLIHTKTNDLADRRSAATNAKAALLQSYRSKMAAGDPARMALQEQRREIAAARDARQAERDRLKHEKLEQEQRLVESEAAERQAAADAAAKSEKAHRESFDGLIALAVKDEAQRKAERDRRYANRKAQKK